MSLDVWPLKRPFSIPGHRPTFVEVWWNITNWEKPKYFEKNTPQYCFFTTVPVPTVLGLKPTFCSKKPAKNVRDAATYGSQLVICISFEGSPGGERRQKE